MGNPWSWVEAIWEKIVTGGLLICRWGLWDRFCEAYAEYYRRVPGFVPPGARAS